MNSNTSKDKPVAIIIGLACLQGLQAARIFARHNVPVIALAEGPEYFYCRTKVCREIHYVNTRTEEFIAFLVERGPGFSTKPVLVPCQDENVWHLSRNRYRLARWYHFLLPEHDTLDMLMDKSTFYRFAEEKGYPVPATSYVRNERELHVVAQEIDYPCLVKPPSRNTQWGQHSTFKAYKIDNREDLLALYNVCRNWTDTLLVQQWIEGTDAELYSCNCYFNANSEPLATFVARKIRQYPPGAGESCLGEECRNDTVLKVSLDLFREVGLRGLGYLEMKRDVRTGKHYIIEPNIGRPTGRSAIAEAGGVELLYTMYCDQLAWPLPAERQQTYTDVKWIHLSRDCASAFHYWRKGELSLLEWLQSIRGKKAYAIFSLRDPFPFLVEILRKIKLVMSSKQRLHIDSSSALSSLKLKTREKPGGDLVASKSSSRSQKGS